MSVRALPCTAIRAGGASRRKTAATAAATTTAATAARVRAPRPAWLHARATAARRLTHTRFQDDVCACGGPPRQTVRAAAADPIETKGDAPGKAALERPSHAEECRTMMQAAGTCFLATASAELGGHPFGSMVDVAVDAQGRPLFCISTLSGHTKDLAQDARCSVTVQQPHFQGIQDGRCTLVGTVSKVAEADVAEAKATFMAKHPEAFWAEFADFSLWRMDTMLKARYVGGFGRAGTVSAEAYAAAAPDPVAPFTPMIAGHMNADHKDTLVAMLAHYGDLQVDDAEMVALDKLGMDLQVKQGDDAWRQRLPFVYPATDRKMVKEVLVEMTKVAKAALQPQGETDAPKQE